jgi:hypothetical protein
MLRRWIARVISADSTARAAVRTSAATLSRWVT